MHLFKVWSTDRAKKIILTVDESNVLLKLIAKDRLLLNSDGSIIDEDDALLLLKHETLILLGRNEKWKPEIVTCISPASTLTVSGCSSEGLLSDSNNEYTDTSPSVQLTSNSSIIGIPLELSYNSNTTKERATNESEPNLEERWLNWKVPWDKIPQHVLQTCEKGLREKNISTTISHIVVNELTNMTKLIPARILKSVAKEIVAKYPESFGDVDDDGVTLGDGSSTLYNRLYERASYLRRPHKRLGRAETSTSPSLFKKKRNVSAGCSNWAPVCDPLSEDTTTKNAVNTYAHTEQISNCLLELLEKTYSNQRTFLNNVANPPSVQEIKAEWPILFNKVCIKWHFEKLTDKSIDTLTNNILAKAERIITFGKEKTKIKMETGAEEPIAETCLQFIARYFKEDLTKLWIRDKNLQGLKSGGIRILSPCLLEVVLSGKKSYNIYMEDEEITQSDSFLEAFGLTFALYFILNLEYPREVSTFMEFIQRYLLKIQPDLGSKSKCRFSKKRVIALTKKLNF